jgi:hypothetical protein
MEEGEFQTIYNEVKDTALHKIKYMWIFEDKEEAKELTSEANEICHEIERKIGKSYEKNIC